MPAGHWGTLAAARAAGPGGSLSLALEEGWGLRLPPAWQPRERAGAETARPGGVLLLLAGPAAAVAVQLGRTKAWLGKGGVSGRLLAPLRCS